jgi:hypothetical protein
VTQRRSFSFGIAPRSKFRNANNANKLRAAASPRRGVATMRVKKRGCATLLTNLKIKTVLQFVSRVAQPRFLTPRDHDAPTRISATRNLLALLAFSDLLRHAIPNQIRFTASRGNEFTPSLAL